MNGYAVLFDKTSTPVTLLVTQCTALLEILEYNVFGIGISGVSMRSKIIPLSSFYISQLTSLGARTLGIKADM
jgi:hypothetical protein